MNDLPELCYYRSQDHVRQDRWVDETLGKKRNGTFLDVGCGHHERISNTYFFEKVRSWRGVGVDINEDFRAGWLLERKRSVFIRGDATEIDYLFLLNDAGMPSVIDYLSLDLEPPEQSFEALKRVMESGRKFRCISFETDWYRCKTTREPSRELLSSLGYELAKGGDQDDFWILKA